MGVLSRRVRGRRSGNQQQQQYDGDGEGGGTRLSGELSSSDGGRTNDAFPVDALSLQARHDDDIALDELESRAEQVERALRMVDQEIMELERATTASQSGHDSYRHALVPSGGAGALDFLPGSQQRMSHMSMPFSTAGMNTPMAIPQQVTINNFHHPVNQMFNSSTTHGSDQGGQSGSGRRARGGRKGRRAKGSGRKKSKRLRDRLKNSRKGGGGGGGEVASRSGGDDDYQMVEYDGGGGRRGGGGSFESNSTGNSSSSSFDSLRSSLSSMSSSSSSSSSYSRSTSRRWRRKKGRSPLAPPETPVEGKNVFRDISKLAKEKADDEDKDLLMAIKASIGFAAAMIGEALFLRLREWLDGAKPAVKRTSGRTAPTGGLLGTMGAGALAGGGGAQHGGWGTSNRASEHPAVVRARTDTKLKDLVSKLKSQGKTREAEMLLKRSLEIRRELYGNEHPAVAHTLNQLATLMCEQGKLDEAEPMFKDSLEICRKVYDGNHPKEAILLNNMAVLMLLRANEDENAKEQAAEMGMRALAIAKQKYGMDHPMTQAYLHDWGDAEAEKEEARQREAAATATAAADAAKSRSSGRRSSKKSKVGLTSSSAAGLEKHTAEAGGVVVGQGGEPMSSSSGSLNKHLSSKSSHKRELSMKATKGNCVVQ